jgi:hypothetical protein
MGGARRQSLLLMADDLLTLEPISMPSVFPFMLMGQTGATN